MSITTPLGQKSQAVDAFVTALVAAFAASADQLGDRVVTEMQEHVPAVQRLQGPALESLRHELRKGVRFYLDSAAHGRRMTAAQTRDIEAIAVALGDMGLTHDDVVEAMRVATRTSWLFLVERARALPATPAAVEGLGTLLLETLEFLQDCFSALARGFVRQHDQRFSARGELVDDLLSGAFDSDAKLAERARPLGVDLGQPHGIVFFVAARSAASSSETLRQVKSEYALTVPGTLESPVRSVPTPHAAVFFPAASAAAWSAGRERAAEVAATHEVVALVVGPVNSPRALHEAYVDTAQHAALAAVAAAPGLVELDDLAVYRILASAGRQEAVSLLSRTLGPLWRLTENRRATLLETLDALWANEGRVSDAADALAITERALRYRIRRIQELTGLDADDPAGRLQLDLARHALRLYPEHLPSHRRTSPNGRASPAEA